MKKYVVNYKAELGDLETFGIFENQEDAVEWMMKDANECIEQASKNGVHYVIQESTTHYEISIQHHGTWNVNVINEVN